MRKKRRENEAFSISFLDVITCGFGAIILLLMIAKTGDSPILETAVDSMHGIVRQLQVQLFEIRGEARILNRELDAKHEQRSEWEQRVARLEAELIKEELRYNSVRDDSAVGVIIKGEFELALQQLTAEMKRLLAQKDRVRTDLIGGIPVDSEYVIFIIDTSGSMVNYHWENMIKQLITTLNVYPRLKGIQIMSDMGEYLFSQYRRTWIPIRRAGARSSSIPCAAGGRSATAVRWKASPRRSAAFTIPGKRSASTCTVTSLPGRRSGKCWTRWSASTRKTRTATPGCASMRSGFRCLPARGSISS